MGVEHDEDGTERIRADVEPIGRIARVGRALDVRLADYARQVVSCCRRSRRATFELQDLLAAYPNQDGHAVDVGHGELGRHGVVADVLGEAAHDGVEVVRAVELLDGRDAAFLAHDALAVFIDRNASLAGRRRGRAPVGRDLRLG